jgi:cellulose synthase/poly-beta-1,6-N-acetylglucosamine synthase-like glycosyltransferase
VGGYARDTVGEDMELVTRLRRRAIDRGRPHQIMFLAESVAWTEAPETFRHLAAQRIRWYRGLVEVLFRHRSMIGRRA